MATLRLDKGSWSNLLSLALLTTGWLGRQQGWAAGPWLLAAGLFGFAGGMTNWLAVKMLFDRVPLLYGSGVIPARFREIRSQIRTLILRHFFAVDYLERYFAAHAAGSDAAAAELQQRFMRLLEGPEVEAAVDGKLAELLASPMGMMLQMAGAERIKGLVREFVHEVGVALLPRLQQELAAAAPSPAALRAQVDDLLNAKLQELTPDTVKRMMEEVIREHLGWLIVWGNVFGAAIGLLSRALGYASG